MAGVRDSTGIMKQIWAPEPRQDAYKNALIGGVPIVKKDGSRDLNEGSSVGPIPSKDGKTPTPTSQKR